MKKKNILMVITVVSLLLNIYTISTLNRVVKTINIKINTDISNIGGLMGIYGVYLEHYLDDPSEKLHSELIRLNSVYSMNVSSIKNLSWGAFGKKRIGNHQIIRAVNRVNTGIMFIEGHFSQIRSDIGNDRIMLIEKLGEDYEAFLKSYAIEIQSFGEKVRMFYANPEDEYYEASMGNRGKTELEREIVLQGEKIDKLQAQWHKVIR